MPALRRVEWERSCPVAGHTSSLIAGSGALGPASSVWNTVTTNWDAATLTWGI